MTNTDSIDRPSFLDSDQEDFWDHFLAAEKVTRDRDAGSDDLLRGQVHALAAIALAIDRLCDSFNGWKELGR